MVTTHQCCGTYVSWGTVAQARDMAAWRECHHPKWLGAPSMNYPGTNCGQWRETHSLGREKKLTPQKEKGQP